MKIFLVRHNREECYAKTNNDQPILTNERDKAFKFGTHELANKCRDKMLIPVAWDIIEVKFENGRIIDPR